MVEQNPGNRSTDDTPGRFNVEMACYRKQIQDLDHPDHNHPIHDAVDMIEYDGGRYCIAITLDGVSESSSADKKTVPIGRMLGWDLSRHCATENPATMDDFDEWFASTVSDAKYSKKGSTTVAMIRFDRESGNIDGLNIGDSYVIMATDQEVDDGEGGKTLACESRVLAPLHCVANDPGILYKGWRFGHQFEPVIFEGRPPLRWVNLYLITMSDGHQKTVDAVQERLIDFNELEDVLARRFSRFARVYLPDALKEQYPDLKRDNEGRIPFEEAAARPDLMAAVADYHEKATEDELAELLAVRLDCPALRKLMLASRGPGAEAEHARKIIRSAHPTLAWTFEAQYADNLDEYGLEDTLRQYIQAELFARAMIEEMYPGDKGAEGMQHRLKKFVDSLGPIADDFSVSMMRIRHNPPA